MPIASRFFFPAVILPLISALMSGCATSPLGRNQLMLVSDSQMNQMGVATYQQIKQDTPITKDHAEQRYVQCITDALTATLEHQQHWEVNVFADDSANAFALPGGKIGVHTGLLNVAKNADQLAAVIGHEIGHVLARHSNERMSLQMATQSGVVLLGQVGGDDTQEKQMITTALGLGAQYGINLPFSRKHEAEADIIGLRIMAAAGFNPQQSIALWQNMAAANGASPPEFFSTHPSNKTRIDGLSARIPEFMPLYQQARASGHTPHCTR